MDTEGLLEALRDSVRREVGRAAEVAVAYSGGLDSSVIAALASERVKVSCQTWAVEGSFDAANVVARAEEERLHVHLNLLGPERLKSAVASASAALETRNPLQLAYTVPLVLVLEESAEKVVLVGNGADELFGGYSKYTSMDDPEAKMSSDLEKMLREADHLRHWAETKGKTIGLPFAGDEVIRISRDIPLSRKIAGDERKVVLRDVARLLGLPSHNRPKKAAQYSSGVLKLMQSMARREGLSLTQWTDEWTDGKRHKLL
jgi:asparagine synthase (glutamine-hydrolysing)